MYCRDCGKKVEDGRDYCADCEAKRNTTKATGYENVVNQVPNANLQKSKIAAGLFGIFLGAFGVHNFYLGYTGKAIAQLLITVLSCFMLSVVSEVWGLIEGILILTGSINTDAQGNPLKE